MIRVRQGSNKAIRILLWRDTAVKAIHIILYYMSVAGQAGEKCYQSTTTEHQQNKEGDDNVNKPTNKQINKMERKSLRGWVVTWSGWIGGWSEMGTTRRYEKLWLAGRGRKY